MKNPFEAMGEALAFFGKIILSSLAIACYVLLAMAFVLILSLPIILWIVSGNPTWLFIYFGFMILATFNTKTK